MKFPKIKKKVNAFLLEEEGKISKKNMIKGGVVLGAAALALFEGQKLVSAGMEYNDHLGHKNGLNVGTGSDQGQIIGVQGAHNHHLSHASYDVYNDHQSYY
tara:strand:+ start:2588 stop:2890 length:303 start_codon:yes stop_codon:yes gene_type:complete